MPLDSSHQHSSADIMQAAAPHTPIDPSGGSGVSVDNGVDAPAAVTTLMAPGANVSVPGLAGLVGVTVSNADPGAIGPNNVWIRVDVDYGLVTMFVRNAADDGWLGYGDAADKALSVYGIDGANPTPTAAIYTGAHNSPGGGIVHGYVQNEGETELSNFLINRSVAQLMFSGKGIKANVDGIGFNNATPVIPVIPSTPTAQDVTDALVALGLVTQAP